MLATIFEHRADFADLYFQYTRSESFSLEEGIVKSGSFDIEQGVGVRAVAGDKTAFAYSDDISIDALNEAAVAARAIARQGSGRTRVAAAIAPRPQAALYGTDDPVASLDAAEKIRLLERIEQLARARDPRVKQVMANVGAEYDVVLVARSDGVLAADVRPLVQLSVTVIVEGRRAPRAGIFRRRRAPRPRLLHRRSVWPTTRTRPSTRRWSIWKRGRRRPA